MSFTELGIWLNKMTTLQIETAIMNLVLEIRQDNTITTETYNDSIIKAMTDQWTIQTYPFIELQKQYSHKGSQKCEQSWAATPSTKLIEIIYDMHSQHNEVLHQKDNVITKQDHAKINSIINNIHDNLSENRRVLIHSEQKLFQVTMAEIVTKRILRWKTLGKKANTILMALSSRQDKQLARIMYNAVGMSILTQPPWPHRHTAHHVKDLNWSNAKRRKIQRDTGWLIKVSIVGWTHVSVTQECSGCLLGEFSPSNNLLVSLCFLKLF